MEGNGLILAGIALGAVAGLLGGMFGIGGGLVLVPAMIFLFGFPLKMATGTSLVAQLLPVGLLGVLAYHRDGNVRFGVGLSIAFGLFLGMYFGALLAGQISPALMKRLYGIFLVSVGIYFLFAPQGVKSRPQALPTATAPQGPAPESVP